MLVTLILRFIHFVGLCLGKNTSGTISRTPARFSENQACTCYRVRSRLSHSHHRYPKLCSVAERFEEMFRFERTMAQLLYLYDHSKAARRILISGHTGRLIYSKLGETLGGYSPSVLLPLNGSRGFGGDIQHHAVYVFDFVRNPVRDFC